MFNAGKSFRSRVSLWSVCVSGLVLLVFITGSVIWIRHEFLELIETDARSMASVVAVAVESGTTDLNRRLGGHNEEQYRVAAVLDGEGNYLFRDENLWEDEMARALKDNGYAFSKDGYWRIRLYQKNDYVVYLAASLAETENEYLEFVRAYAMGLPLALALAAWGGWWLGGRVTQPIRSMANVISKVTPKGLNLRVPNVEREDEIGELARLINGMLDRVQAGYEQARRFTGDASHELRTPLAILQSELEQRIREADEDGADQASNGRMLDEVRRLKALTNALLFLARVDAGTLELDKEEVNLDEALSECVDELSCEKAATGLEWSVSCPEGLTLSGEPNLLCQLVRNLLRNAALYNRNGGRVDCMVEENGEEICIRIGNTGPEVPQHLQPRLFDRFFRGAQERSRRKDGFGLGLNIAQAIAQAHEGSLKLLKSDGDWTEFELILPRSGGK